MLVEKRGLWDNIHAKRKRIAAGSGERMRKPGSTGAPSASDLKASQVKENDAKKDSKDPSNTLKILKKVVKEALYECNGNCTCGKNPNPPVTESEYQGKQVSLGKPMKGDVKKSKVYVKNE